MSTPAPEPAARRWRGFLGLLVTAAVLSGGTSWLVHHRNDLTTTVADTAPVAVPVLTPVGAVRGAVPWDKPLTVAVTDGTLAAVIVTDPDGLRVEGRLDDRRWSSPDTLLPSSTYRVSARVLDAAGGAHALGLVARTSAPRTVLHAVLSPGDDKVVGVGLPVIVTLDQPVKPVDRPKVVARLRVATEPAVTGGWRWMSPTELHYRGPSYWQQGTRITAALDFDRLSLSDGMWGEGTRTSSYRIGAAMVSTVDVESKTMTVTRDGKVLRVLKVSTGREKYPTKGGVHLVLEKTRLKIMDSSTVGIPRNSPAGYYEKVPFSVRISYSGEFVHSAGWSVRDQGVRNVSHGCVNLSPSDAQWFYGLAVRGDVVDVIHTTVKPLLYDPGTSDWNVPFSNWTN